MSFTIVDRRPNGKGKSIENRQKFLRRIRQSIKKAMPDLLNTKKLKDINSDKGGIVHIPQKNLKEPSFRHGTGGTRDTVHPGNKEFSTGDRLKKPPQGSGGSGRKGSNEGEGEDDFVVEISRDEFLDVFFEDLELPDLVKQNMKEVKTLKTHNAGFTNNGSPAKLDVERSMQHSHARRIGQRAPYKKKLRAAEEELAQLQQKIIDNTDPSGVLMVDMESEQLRIAELEIIIAGLKRKIAGVSFLDPMDLRYHATVQEVVKKNHAVMFCVMDNSGSMGEREKILSRKFFILLYLFLENKYESVDVRFVYHTTVAREVEEDEFFSTRDSGGTVVSSALDLVNDIIKSDYGDGLSNLYISQCSDGDNWSQDNGTCYELLVDDIMPAVQYYAYLQVDPEGSMNYVSDIWPSYELVAKEFSNFQMARVQDEADIYPVFRELFEKKT